VYRLSEGGGRSRRLVHAVCGGIFLIGLAVLFHFNAFWPWILALLGAIVIAEALITTR
jgi:hypothetical protein